MGFDPIASSHFHVIEYIEKEQDDECKGVDTYSSKTIAWIYKESKWGPNTCVTFERLETMYLNGCLHIIGYSLILVVDMEGKTWRKIPRPRGTLPVGLWPPVPTRQDMGRAPKVAQPTRSRHAPNTT